MQLQVQLVHAEGGRLVVQVTGWDGDQCLGSALGEAGNAEEAEDRALARLQQRLAHSPAQASQPTQVQGSLPAAVQIPGQKQNPDQTQAHPMDPRQAPNPVSERSSNKEPSLPGEQPKASRPKGQASPMPKAIRDKPASGTDVGSTLEPAQGQPRPLAAGEGPPAPMDPIAQDAAGSSVGGRGQLTLGSTSAEPVAAVSGPAAAGAAAEQAADPEDWSDELAALEVQLQRLGWQRDQESIYLQRAYGHPSRSRLTSYGDLVAYLNAVRQFEAPANPADVAVPIRRGDLLAMSDQLLAQLGWDATSGREVLETHFQRTSRQQLNDEELLSFNMILEGELVPDITASKET